MDGTSRATVVADIRGMPDNEVQRIRRSAGVGGSEIAAVLGLSPWTTELELYGRKRGELAPQDATERMDWGKRLESTIIARRAEDAAAVGLTVVRPERIYRSVAHPDVCYSPDAFEVPLGERLDLDDPRARWFGVDDAKTQSAWDTAEWDTEHPRSVNGIPVHYWLQLQQGALVLGADELAVDVLFGGSDYRRFVCEPDREVGEMLAEAATAFMDRVREGRPPAADPSHRNTAGTLAALHRGHEGMKRVLSEDTTRALLDLTALSEQRDWADEQIEQIRNRVRAELGDATEGVCPWTGKVLVTWPPLKETTERTVTVSDVRARYPHLYRGLARRVGREAKRSTRINVRAKAVGGLRESGKATERND